MTNIEILQLIKEKIPQFADDIDCGLHSNIPHCCILFFLSMNYKTYHDIQDPIEKMRGIKFEYRPCPDCLVNKIPNQLKDCDSTNCNKSLREAINEHEINY